MAGVLSNEQGVQTASTAPTAPGKRGGRRAGAGRKKKTKDTSHSKRPPLSSKHPIHVTLRTQQGVPRLRQARVHKAIRRTLLRYLGRDAFRIVHISIQYNHIHLIIEAAGRTALTHGMQSFTINAARGINAACRRTGKVFEFRYHAKQIKTDRYARNVLSYVLNNWRRHREDIREDCPAIFDKFSSASSFEGWTIRTKEVLRFYEPLPVSPPETALLSDDWQWWGLIDPFERPGPV